MIGGKRGDQSTGNCQNGSSWADPPGAGDIDSDREEVPKEAEFRPWSATEEAEGFGRASSRLSVEELLLVRVLRGRDGGQLFSVAAATVVLVVGAVH